MLAFLAGAAATPALAQPARESGGVQPLDRLLPEIRRHHPGNFYDAEGPTFGPDGQPHYHLKWMTPDGRIVWFDADARSGRVLRSSPGRDGFDGPRRQDFRGVPPGYQQFGQPGARDPNEDRYRSRFGGSFDARRNDYRDRDRESHGPRWDGPRAGDFGRRDGRSEGRHEGRREGRRR